MASFIYDSSVRVQSYQGGAVTGGGLMSPSIQNINECGLVVVSPVETQRVGLAQEFKAVGSEKVAYWAPSISKEIKGPLPV